MLEFCSMNRHRLLIKECLKNNPTSQKQLYQEFAEVMLGVCRRYTKSMADAEDVMQEGFIKIFTQLHQYKNEGELGAWIRRIMVNTALNFIKHNARYQHNSDYDKIEMHPITDENPQIHLDTKELLSLICKLPFGYQTVFNLHAIEGYTHVDIARLLNISENTSRSQYSRARALMIAWIKKNYSDEKLQQYAQ